MDVYYEWIRKDYSDGSKDSVNYNIGNTIPVLIYGTHEAYEILLMDINYWSGRSNLGQELSRYTYRGDFVDKVTSYYSVADISVDASYILDDFEGYNLI